MDLNFLLNKAIKLHLKKDFDRAEKIYKKIIKSNPDNIIANSNLGSLLNASKKFEEALDYLDRSLKLKPDFIDALNNKGNAMKGLKRYNEALEIYEEVLKINPLFLDSLNNKANCLKALKKYEEAITIYNKAININENFVEAIYNQGICYYLLGNFSSAIECNEKVIKLNPNFKEGHYNLGLLQLTVGNYAEGWKHYEWRKNQNNQKTEYPIQDKEKEWLGDHNIKNKIIYIIKEQGLGDYINYCRYLPMVEALGAKIILDTPDVLKPLIDNMKINYTHTSELKKINFDHYCYICSLPYVFNSNLNNIPNKVPYFSTSNEEINYWKKKIFKTSRKKIGLKWSGSKAHKNDKNRSLKLNEILSLFELPFEFYSLDFDLSEEDKQIIKKIPNLNFYGEDLLGLERTAGLIHNLDLIISVDTSMAHLSGALGKEVWILLHEIPDYRWLLDTDKTIWYPSAKLFRKKKFEKWENIIQIIKKNLLKLK